MYFERKVYSKLLEWKRKYADNYAILLEGARRVGKSTIAKNFAQNEYKSYILLDFSKIEAGKMTLVERAYDTKKMLSGVIDIISVQAEKKDLEFLKKCILEHSVQRTFSHFIITSYNKLSTN